MGMCRGYRFFIFPSLGQLWWGAGGGEGGGSHLPRAAPVRGRGEGATGKGWRGQLMSADPQMEMRQSPAASRPFSLSPSLEKEGRGFIYPMEMGLGRHELTPAQKSLYQRSRERNGETANAAPPRPTEEHLKKSPSQFPGSWEPGGEGDALGSAQGEKAQGLTVPHWAF